MFSNVSIVDVTVSHQKIAEQNSLNHREMLLRMLWDIVSKIFIGRVFKSFNRKGKKSELKQIGILKHQQNIQH